MDIHSWPTYLNFFLSKLFFWKKYGSEIPYLPMIWTYVQIFVGFFWISLLRKVNVFFNKDDYGIISSGQVLSSMTSLLPSYLRSFKRLPLCLWPMMTFIWWHGMFPGEMYTNFTLWHIQHPYKISAPRWSGSSLFEFWKLESHKLTN